MKNYLLLLFSFFALSTFSQTYLLLDENAQDKKVVQKFIQQSIDNEIIRENPLVIIDDKVIENPKNLNQLNMYKSDIVEMSFIPKNQSKMIQQYGSQAINGLIKISTRPFYEKPISKISGNAPGNVLFVVNGKTVSEDEFQNIKPDDIESINVIKDQKYIEKYTLNDYDGIIEIKLKSK